MANVKHSTMRSKIGPNTRNLPTMGMRAMNMKKRKNQRKKQSQDMRARVMNKLKSGTAGIGWGP